MQISSPVPIRAADSLFQTSLRVGHGCGDSPTIEIRVKIPKGVVIVQPQHKPGWTVSGLGCHDFVPVSCVGGIVIKTLCRSSRLASDDVEDMPMLQRAGDRAAELFFLVKMQKLRDFQGFA